jgi:hypothetical protein
MHPWYFSAYIVDNHKHLDKEPAGPPIPAAGGARSVMLIAA